MNQTFIAVFDTFQEAQHAVAKLVEAGFSRENVQVHADDLTLNNSMDQRNEALQHPVEKEGAMHKIEHFFAHLFGKHDHSHESGHYQEAVRRGSAVLTVENVAEECSADLENLLNQLGAIDIDERSTAWEADGYRRPAALENTNNMQGQQGQTFEEVQESASVSKRVAETGRVRVYTRATETPFNESVSLRNENATIERRPVDRPATAADMQTGSVEIVETQERPVITKTARVVEEVQVGKVATDHTENVSDTLRGTKVEIDHEGRNHEMQRNLVSPELK